MKVLVIGGNGFIGSHLVDSFLATADEVSVLDQGPMREDVKWQMVRYFKGSILDDNLLDHAMQNVECVIHSASSSVPASSASNPIEDVQQNLIGVLKVLQAMSRLKVPRIVYLSSGGTVYGITDAEKITESHPCAPISPYGVVKLAAEQYMRVFARSYGLSTLILRPSNPYGPRQSSAGIQGLIGAAIRRVLDGCPIDVWGDGSAVRDYIYISDLIALIVLASRSQKIGVYNAGSGEGASVLAVLNAIGNASNQQLRIQWKSSLPGDVPRVVLDCQAAMNEFDWRPEIQLDEGIQRTWAYITKQNSSKGGDGW